MASVAEAAFGELTAGRVYYTTRSSGTTPRLLVMSGLPMSGKSYLSNMISERLNGLVCVVRSDTVRPVVARHMARSQPLYDKAEHAIVFQVGGMMVSKSLDNAWPTIADATNLTDFFRRWAVDAAVGRTEHVLVAFLEISHETAMDRVREKDRDGSAATPAVYALLNYEKEPADRCTSPYVVINSETDIRPWAESLANWMSGKADSVPGMVRPRISR